MNILFILVTAEVLIPEKLMEVRLEQLMNISVILVNADVSKLDKSRDLRLEQW